MKQEITYKTFDHIKSSSELFYNFLVWTSEFEFIEIELNFLKHLIKTYPFQSKIPNLYEHLQLFIQELDNLEKIKSNLIDKIHTQNIQLSNKLKQYEMNSDNFYRIEYEKISEEIFNYMQNYKNLKVRIFEYVNGLID